MNKEKRYYLVDLNNSRFKKPYYEISDDVFIRESERQGTVYSENGFIEAFNMSDISTSNQVLRILEV